MTNRTLSAEQSFWVQDAGGLTAGWFYFRHNEETARQAKVLNPDEARRLSHPSTATSKLPSGRPLSGVIDRQCGPLQSLTISCLETASPACTILASSLTSRCLLASPATGRTVVRGGYAKFICVNA
jgi:hypothetical protein